MMIAMTVIYSQSYIIPLLYLQLLPLYMEVVFTVNIKSILKKFSHSTSYGSLCIPLKSNFCNNIMCRNGTDHHCEPEKVSGGLPLFWDWVEQAKYAGTRKYHERTLDIWQFEVCRCNQVRRAIRRRFTASYSTLGRRYTPWAGCGTRCSQHACGLQPSGVPWWRRLCIYGIQCH